MLMYGLLAGDRVETSFQASADMLRYASGGLMIVHAEPFTLAARDSGLGCEASAFEFSAVVP